MTRAEEHAIWIASLETEAARQNQQLLRLQSCDHNEMVPNDSPTHVWKCARCGYVYGKTVTP